MAEIRVPVTTDAGAELAHALYEAEGIIADDRIRAIEAEAVERERARIAEAVEGLPEPLHVHTVEIAGHVEKAAVLALVKP